MAASLQSDVALSACPFRFKVVNISAQSCADVVRTPWQWGIVLCKDLVPSIDKRALMDTQELIKHRNLKAYAGRKKVSQRN